MGVRIPPPAPILKIIIPVVLIIERHMKNSTLIKIVVSVVISFALYGFVFPSMISEADSMTVILGALSAFIVWPAFVYKMFKRKNNA